MVGHVWLQNKLFLIPFEVTVMFLVSVAGSALNGGAISAAFRVRFLQGTLPLLVLPVSSSAISSVTSSDLQGTAECPPPLLV